jgi:hypothetical protein
MKLIPIALLPLILVACSEPPAVEAVPEAAVVRGPNAFDVALTLTPRAAEKLAGMGEEITVDAVFFGEPRPGGLKPEDENDFIPMGGEQVNAPPANGVIMVPGESYDPAREADVEGGKQVLVNAWTSRKAHEDNLISCGIYQGPLAMAQKQPVEIRCDLIE